MHSFVLHTRSSFNIPTACAEKMTGRHQEMGKGLLFTACTMESRGGGSQQLYVPSENRSSPMEHLEALLSKPTWDDPPPPTKQTQKWLIVRLCVCVCVCIYRLRSPSRFGSWRGRSPWWTHGQPVWGLHKCQGPHRSLFLGKELQRQSQRDTENELKFLDRTFLF